MFFQHLFTIAMAALPIGAMDALDCHLQACLDVNNAVRWCCGGSFAVRLHACWQRPPVLHHQCFICVGCASRCPCAAESPDWRALHALRRFARQLRRRSGHCPHSHRLCLTCCSASRALRMHRSGSWLQCCCESASPGTGRSSPLRCAPTSSKRAHKQPSSDTGGLMITGGSPWQLAV